MSFDPCTTELLREKLDHGFAQMGEASTEILTSIPEFDERRAWEADGAASMSGWLCLRYRIAYGTALEWVRVARAVRELPAIFRTYSEGRLSWDQLRPLTKLATPETDAAWAEKARGMEPAELWQEDQRRQKRRREEAENDHRMRNLHMSWDENCRFLDLHAQFAAEQGARIEAALETRAKEIVLTEDLPAGERKGAKLADALEELVGSSGESPQPATLVVHADAKVLADAPADGELRLAETQEGIRLADETIRRLACDARIEWLLEREGRTVGIGRRGRQVPGTIQRAIRQRDRGCRFPGCSRRTYVHAHHLTHWGRGGRTDLGNLLLLCAAHHRLLHEGGWRTSGNAEKGLRFHDPTGRPIRAGPAERAA